MTTEVYLIAKALSQMNAAQQAAVFRLVDDMYSMLAHGIPTSEIAVYVRRVAPAILMLREDSANSAGGWLLVEQMPLN